MTPADLAAAFGAGIACGGINAVVGSGTLVTFPVLLALGYSPLVANVSNTVGLVPGGFSGVAGYRRELEGQGRRIATLGAAALIGGTVGAALLLELPASVFKGAVPVLILVACALVLLQPVARRVAAARGVGGTGNGGWPLRFGAFLVAIYGGYFGAAQGVVLMSMLGTALHDGIQRLNALKIVLALASNVAAAIVYAVVAPVAWPIAGALAAGTLLGGYGGAKIGRRLSPKVLRGAIVVIGVVAAVKLLA
ncbi:MAG: sulfite exporter TauE/SafE family protein [Acidimicrobiales bacterium]